jgi:hypothetical protein
LRLRIVTTAHGLSLFDTCVRLPAAQGSPDNT